jgi:hypothetical protein
MTTQIDVVDINDNTNDITDDSPVEVKPEEVKPKAKAKPRAEAKAKVKEEDKGEVKEARTLKSKKDSPLWPSWNREDPHCTSPRTRTAPPAAHDPSR